MEKTFKYSIPFLLLFPAGLLLCLSGKYVDGFSDWYFNRIYVPLASSIGSITGSVPFSLAELFIILAAVLLVILIAKTIYAINKRKEKASHALIKLLLTVLSVASAVFFLFSVFSGVNYHRSSFTSLSGMDVKASSKEELYDLCCYLAERANTLSESLEHDENGCTVIDESYAQMAADARKLYSNLYDKYPFMNISDSDSFARPKPVFFSKVLSYLLISGIHTPYTLEANFCTEGPVFLKGSTMMHEISHLYGFMNEAESNFIAFDACYESGNAYFEYSGTCLALIYCGNALYSADYELWKSFRSMYNTYLNSDMKANNDYISSYESTVSDVSDSINDTYLKLNSVTEGVKSYGKMVDLMLCWYRENIT